MEPRSNRISVFVRRDTKELAHSPFYGILLWQLMVTNTATNNYLLSLLYQKCSKCFTCRDSPKYDSSMRQDFSWLHYTDEETEARRDW